MTAYCAFQARATPVSKQAAQFRIAGTADRQLGLVVEYRNTTVLLRKLDLCQSRYVQHIAPMDAQESPPAQLCLEFSERLFLEVASAGRADRHIVVLRFDIVDLLDRNDVHIRAIPNQHAIDRAALAVRIEQCAYRQRIARAHPDARQLQRFVETLGAERLQ